MSVLATVHMPTLLGTAPDNPARWMVPTVVAALFLVGQARGWWLKAAHLDVYQRIGLGADATVTTRPSPTPPPPREPRRTSCRGCRNRGGS